MTARSWRWFSWAVTRSVGPGASRGAKQVSVSMSTTAPTLPTPGRSQRAWLTSGMALIWAIALAKFLFHVYFNNRYGYFRDEFNYIACGDHLGWGYVDQPPLIPFLIHVCRAVLGDSLRSIRFIPPLPSSLLLVQAALISRELGGKRFALR